MMRSRTQAQPRTNNQGGGPKSQATQEDDGRRQDAQFALLRDRSLLESPDQPASAAADGKLFRSVPAGTSLYARPGAKMAGKAPRRGPSTRSEMQSHALTTAQLTAH